MTAPRETSSLFKAMGTESGVKYLAEARALEAKGVDIVHLEIGEPHFGTPQPVIDAGIAALRAGATHYGPPAGIPELRAALARDATHELGVGLTADNVAVLPGSKLVLVAILIAYTDPGDEIMYFEPGFPAYGAVARMLGRTPIAVRLAASDAFRPTREGLERAASSRSRVLVANWPSNPIGTVLRPDDAAMIGDFARERDILVVSDELYRGLEFQPGTSLFAAIGDPARCVLMDGFSKRWAMTGWRLAYAIGSVEIARAIAAVATNTITCATTFSQQAALAVFDGLGAWRAGMHGELQQLRDTAVSLLPAALKADVPEAGLYLFAKAADPDSRALAARLVAAGVATMPGAAFGGDGEGHLRITFSVPEQRLREGMRRLADALP
ncbi:MAG: aminotransferase class I/II-fold pyridoxal phosphate-dependent enzyme [Chloroflexota bacterium]